ncbi:MAG: alanine--glyoxylate aminotransferase family protein, partial [Chloroflexota bacterium]|nr:alanine--glyoxylate aminotransferase family protein [Chloroflexota bacterium]
AAWEAHKSATMPRFYWDWTIALEYQRKGENPYTPPVSLYFGLHRSLQLMFEEGLQNIFQRHIQVGEFTRRGMERLNLEMFAKPGWASSVVTAVRVPDGVDGKQIVRIMEDKHGVVLAGGQEHLAGKIFRVGHMGWVHQADIEECLAALRQTLQELGHKLPAEAVTG